MAELLHEHRWTLCVLMCTSTHMYAHCASKSLSSVSFGQLPNLFWSSWTNWASLCVPSDVMGQWEWYGSGSMPSQPVAVVLCCYLIGHWGRPSVVSHRGGSTGLGGTIVYWFDRKAGIVDKVENQEYRDVGKDDLIISDETSSLDNKLSRLFTMSVPSCFQKRVSWFWPSVCLLELKPFLNANAPSPHLLHAIQLTSSSQGLWETHLFQQISWDLTASLLCTCQTRWPSSPSSSSPPLPQLSICSLTFSLGSLSVFISLVL